MQPTVADAGPDRDQQPANGLDRIVVVSTVVGFAVLAVAGVLRGAAIGYDEATYAARARAMATGEPYGPYWADYRAPGMSMLAHLLHFGSSVTPYRLLVVVFAVAGLVITWWLGRQLLDARSATIATLLLAISAGYYRSAVEFLPDLPGAVIGLGAVATFLMSFGSRRRWAWAAATVVLAVVATYVRFGAPVPIAIGLVVVLVARWTDVRRRPVPALVIAGVTAAAIGAVVLVPTLTGATTSPYRANQVLASHYPPKSLLQIAKFQPAFMGLDNVAAVRVIGALVFVVYVVGLVAAVVIVARGQRRSAGLIACGFGAGGTFIALLAVLPGGELRYVAPVAPWVALTAGAGLAYLLATTSERLQVIALAAIGVLGFVLLAVLTYSLGRAGDPERFYEQMVRATSPTSPCTVVTNYRPPQYAWYGPCTVARLPGTPAELRATIDGLPAGSHVVVVSDTSLVDGSTPDAAGLQEATGVSPRPVEGRPTVWLYPVR